jgi:hypothetical protein
VHLDHHHHHCYRLFRSGLLSLPRYEQMKSVLVQLFGHNRISVDAANLFWTSFTTLFGSGKAKSVSRIPGCAIFISKHMYDMMVCLFCTLACCILQYRVTGQSCIVSAMRQTLSCHIAERQLTPERNACLAIVSTCYPCLDDILSDATEK